MLSISERLLLLNQYRILEMVDTGQKDGWRKAQMIVEHGYEEEYHSLFGCIGESELSRARCKKVQDILDMYQAMRGANPSIEFPGFDANNETAEYFYARFLVGDGRWVDLQTKHGLNSHVSKLPQYSRMLEVWKACNDPVELTKLDVERILATK